MPEADHLDLSGFLARDRRHGGFYRYAGYALLAGACTKADDPTCLSAVVIASAVIWLLAWRDAVGALWRGPLVAAALAGALLLLRHGIHCP